VRVPSLTTGPERFPYHADTGTAYTRLTGGTQAVATASGELIPVFLTGLADIAGWKNQMYPPPCLRHRRWPGRG
ncbi:MAG: hypothetical protein ACUVSM_00270, partial [Armatimonadota bacterium]